MLKINWKVPPNIKGLIFDCDGTLVDTMPAHYQSWRAAFDKLGVNFFDEDIFHNQLSGMSGVETVSHANRIFGYQLHPKETNTLKDNLFIEKYSAAVQRIDAIVAVADYYYRKIPMAVASGGTQGVVALTLKQVKLDHYFPVVVTCEQVKQGKPAPDLFLLAAKHLNLAPYECLVFEDAQAGFKAAEDAGMQYVNVVDLIK